MKYHQSIEKKMNLPGLSEKLAALSGSDLNTLLMEVFRSRAGRINPSSLVNGLFENRFTQPGSTDPIALKKLELYYLEVATHLAFSVVQLSPLAPLGVCSSMAPVAQNTIVSSLRNTEIVSDVTNVLALMTAQEVRKNQNREQVIRLATTHRHVRAQAFDRPGFAAHFSIAGFTTGGWDQGNHRFETTAFLEHVTLHRRIIRSIFPQGPLVIRIYWQHAADRLQTSILKGLEELPDSITLEQESKTGDFTYYPVVQFKILLVDSGQSWELADGGLVSWTQELIPNHKHRLMISGTGLDLILRANQSIDPSSNTAK
ncbi:MAG: hypothetical protein R2806_02425 [Saprospiraceae bacterium]